MDTSLKNLRQWKHLVQNSIQVTGEQLNELIEDYYFFHSH
jgi:hypothetical protein